MLADRRFGLHQQRAGIHRSRDAEHASAGHIVARPDGSLHGGRATPMRQQREMQVVPAAGQRVQHGLLQDSSVCDDRGGLCAGDLQLVKERRLGRVGFQYRQSQFQRGVLTGLGVSLRPRPVGASGRVRHWRPLRSARCPRRGRAGTVPRRQACRQRGFSTCVPFPSTVLGLQAICPVIIVERRTTCRRAEVTEPPGYRCPARSAARAACGRPRSECRGCRPRSRPRCSSPCRR